LKFTAVVSERRIIVRFEIKQVKGKGVKVRKEHSKCKYKDKQWITAMFFTTSSTKHASLCQIIQWLGQKSLTLTGDQLLHLTYHNINNTGE